MRNLKKLLAVLVCMAMALALAPALTVSAADYVEGKTDDGLWYEIYDGHVEIIHYYGNAEELIIPGKIDGLPVTIIGGHAFEDCTGLTSVTIPEGVTSIGEEAFNWCTSLASVTIPGSVTSIGYSAFYMCTSLTNMTIPEGVTDIGEEAFLACTGLTRVSIPSSVVSIGDYVFQGCDSLTEIQVDEGNAYYTSRDGVLFNKNVTKLIRCPIGNPRTAYTIPDDVTSIGDGAFSCCSDLTSVSIPESVISIGVNAFFGCTGLISVSIPVSVTSIGWYAFSGCTGLTSVTIPGSVTDIGDEVFRECSSLTSVSIPNGVEHIGDYAFDDCTGLSSVFIPVSVTSIGYSAFDDCTSLKDVYYTGDVEDWQLIDIDRNNDDLINANIHYNSEGPKAPEIKEPEVTPDEATGKLNVTVDTANVPASAELIAISYGTDGGLVDIAPVENGKASLGGENVKTVKVFCWESLKSMRPLCEAKEVTVAQ